MRLVQECLRGATCQAPGCKTQSVFGFAGQRARFCKAHKIDRMVRRRTRQGSVPLMTLVSSLWRVWGWELCQHRRVWAGADRGLPQHRRTRSTGSASRTAATCTAPTVFQASARRAAGRTGWRAWSGAPAEVAAMLSTS